jgi:hypothetical protein
VRRGLNEIGNDHQIVSAWIDFEIDEVEQVVRLIEHGGRATVGVQGRLGGRVGGGLVREQCDLRDGLGVVAPRFEVTDFRVDAADLGVRGRVELAAGV